MGKGKNSKKNEYETKRKYHKDKQFQDFNEISKIIEGTLNPPKPPTSPQDNGLIIIEIDSEEEIPMPLNKKEDSNLTR